jgi:hypothetical protein
MDQRGRYTDSMKERERGVGKVGKTETWRKDWWTEN